MTQIYAWPAPPEPDTRYDMSRLRIEYANREAYEAVHQFIATHDNLVVLEKLGWEREAEARIAHDAAERCIKLGLFSR